MDAVEFISKKRRMCTHYQNGCTECPIYKAEMSCWTNNIEDKETIEKQVEIVEKWSKENPFETKLTEFLKLFPNITLDTNGYPWLCVAQLDPFTLCRNNCAECKHDFWDAFKNNRPVFGK